MAGSSELRRRNKLALRRAERRGLLAFAVAGALLLLAAVGSYALRDGDAPAIGPFALSDPGGHAVTDQAFRGRWMLVYFGYTSCPDECPTMLGDMAEALNRLGADASQIQPIFITLDPNRDTPSILADYVRSFDSRIVALTGTEDQIAAAARSYRLKFRKHDPGPDGSYGIDHGSILFVIGPDGKYVTHFGPQIDVERVSGTLHKLLAHT